jgi:DNA-binding Lrp family transcriptional regulator
MKKLLPNRLLTQIRSNRHALRRRGFTSADLLALEALAHVAPNGLRRLSVAALGRLIGIKRAGALARIRRLEAAGAVIRVGRALGVNAAALFKWAAESTRDRLAAFAKAKLLKAKRKIGNVCIRERIGEEKNQKAPQSAEWSIISRSDALEQLRATYIPPHLRAAR